MSASRRPSATVCNADLDRRTTEQKGETLNSKSRESAKPPRGGAPARLAALLRIPGSAARQGRALRLAAPLATLALLALPAAAQATAAPWWHLTQRLIPSHLAPEGEGTLVVQAINLGDAPTTGAYEITDDLPSGVTLQGAEFFAPMPAAFGGLPRHEDLGPSGAHAAEGYCTTTAATITCSSQSAAKPKPEYSTGAVVPYEFLEMRLRVKAQAGAQTGANRLVTDGGGASPAAIERDLGISAAAVGFGAEYFALTPEEEGGSIATRAGSHPFQLTTDFTFNRANAETSKPPAAPRDIHFRLPAGLIGNATVMPKCSDVDFALVVAGGQVNSCPPDTAIGATIVTASIFPGEEHNFIVPVFNLVPAPGEPARFGFEVLQNPVILGTSIRSGPGEDYGVDVNVSNITELANFISSTTTFWGVPQDKSHDEARGWGCLDEGRYAKEAGVACTGSTVERPAAFLTMPTDCEAPYVASVDGASWPTQAAPAGFAFPPLEYRPANEAGEIKSLIGCNQVSFDPRIKAEPTSNAVTSPTGLSFDIGFNDEGLTSASGTAQSQVKKVVVTLPQGFTANPSVAAGLIACSEAAYEASTLQAGTGCPQESKIGEVEIESPLIEQVIHGGIYFAEQNNNPNHNLLTIYLVARNAEVGVLVKQPLKVTPDPVTGQLTTEVDNVPQLPFSRFHLAFRQGQRSPLITPSACGTYTVGADLYPWSEPSAAVHRESAFQITEGIEGQGCPSGGTPPFHPELDAGTSNNAAGAYSPLYIRISRHDSEQEITGFSAQLPPGLSGNLTGIPQCTEAEVQRAREQAGAEAETNPACPAGSQIGHTIAEAGVGTALAQTPGRLYLGGPFEGAPFSVVSVTSAKVGPFDLGTVVVHLPLQINPITAQVTLPTGPADQIPHIIDGIVIHLRNISVYVDRSDFIFNPTSCEPSSLTATVIGSGSNFVSAADDQPATVNDYFQTADCSSLKFEPKFTASTSGKTSKAQGASLHVNLTYPTGALGQDTNIKQVKVDLPKQLPSRLTTLQKACTAAQFNANPAGCPKESLIGTAKAITPILPVPLEGPAYFVSHGGEAFPDLEIVLQGDGVTIVLTGNTFISKAGITSSTFKTVPDQPVTSFELTLPEGKFSALGTNKNLCKPTKTVTIKKKVDKRVKGKLVRRHGKLVKVTKKTTRTEPEPLLMPTHFVGQNGAEISQSTPVTVTGCAKAKPAAKKHKKAKAKRKTKKK